MFFNIVFGTLIFLIVFFLFHSFSILDWLGNEINGLFFFYFFVGLSISQ